MKLLHSLVGAIAILGQSSFAIPFLQLDIGGGVYIGGDEESVFSVGNPFTLYALVDTDSGDYSAGLTYYLSAAIVPQTTDGVNDFGSFTVDGNTYDFNNMTYGIPPVGLDSNPGLLGPHDIFDTHYAEISFSTLPGLATPYNSENNPGGPTDDANGTLAYQSFTVDISGLVEGSSVHFDLYTKYTSGNKEGGVHKKAPYSHDAQSNGTSVPDDGSPLALLGMSVIGLAAARRKIGGNATDSAS